MAEEVTREQGVAEGAGENTGDAPVGTQADGEGSSEQEEASVREMFDEMGVPEDARGEFAATEAAAPDEVVKETPLAQPEPAAKPEVEAEPATEDPSKSIAVTLEDGTEGTISVEHARLLAQQPASVIKAYEALRTTGGDDHTAAVAEFARLLQVPLPSAQPAAPVSPVAPIQATAPQTPEIPNEESLITQALLDAGYEQTEIDAGEVDALGMNNARLFAQVQLQGRTIQAWQAADAKAKEQADVNHTLTECDKAVDDVLAQHGADSGLDLDVPAQRDAAKSILQDVTLMQVSSGTAPDVAAAGAMDHLRALTNNTRVISAMKSKARDSRVASVGQPEREHTRPDEVTLIRSGDSETDEKTLDSFLEQVERTGVVPPVRVVSRS